MKMRGVKGGPITRAVGVIGIVLALTSGVTFAALQSQNVKLAGNDIQSATANLLIGTNMNALSNSSVVGYSFTNVEPGGPAIPTTGNTFYLQNAGSTNLALRMSVDQYNNSNNVDLTKVYILLTPVSGGATQTFSLAALVDSYNSGGTGLGITLPSSASAQYRLQVKMDADAITGGPSTGATINNLEFVFNGATTTG